MADLEERIRWAARDDKDADPLEFYNEHYAGLSRGRLALRDRALYQRLRKDGSLENIPIYLSGSGRKAEEIDPATLYPQITTSSTRLTFFYFTRTLGHSESSMGEAAEQMVPVDEKPVQLKDLLYDDFVLAGEKLEAIASAIGSAHRQRAEQYLQKTGQIEKWKETSNLRRQRELQQKEQEARALEKAQETFLNTLVAKMFNEARDDWPLQTALRVYWQKKQIRPNDISLEKLDKLFQWYEYAVEHNEPMSLGDFSRETGLAPTCISHLFSHAGISTLKKIHTQKRQLCSAPEKVRIRSALQKTDFTGTDLEYFTRISGDIFWFQSSAISRTKKNNNYTIQHFSYRKASEIYEARPLMKDEEIQEILGLDDRTYAKYLKHQPEISRKIIANLRQIYPDMEQHITQPYVPRQVRELQERETFEQVVVIEIQRAIANGVKGITELSQETGYAPLTIHKYAARAGIPVPLGKQHYGNDPLGYCHEHYPGITQRKLWKTNVSLSLVLKRKHLLSALPRR
ncbi:hypothetical protein HYU22_00305 [Candidatus Woesearchaeota archaeon]|nr:hypothetical protein [Candidatus Woesearchaeota archaeon]